MGPGTYARGAVLQIPEECISMSRLQKRMIHMEDNWVESADWPFIALSTTSTSVVVPFDEPGQEGVMPELIMIIPLDFFTGALREDLDYELEDHHLGGGDFLWRQYQDAEHFKLAKLKT